MIPDAQARRDMRRRLVPGALCFLAVVFVLPGCVLPTFGLVYSVDVVNYGQYGAIILEIGGHEPFVRKPFKKGDGQGGEFIMDARIPGLEDLAYVLIREPDFPTDYRDNTVGIGQFPRYSRSLPETVEVVWQLADLSECRSVVRPNAPVEVSPNYPEHAKASFEKNRIEFMDQLRAKGYDPDRLIRKSGCIWSPIAGKIYRKTIDMKAIRQSEAYKQSGDSNPDLARSKFVLNLKFVFMDEDLKVEAESRTTNPWK